MTGTLRITRAPLAALVALAVLAVAPAGAHELPAAETPDALPVRQALEPPLLPTPEADCGPGSRPETGIQGRVPLADHESGRAAEGYTCNAERIGHYGKDTPLGTIGGFKVERYVDVAGHECAYYDTTLMYPTNLFDEEAGVNVLDMSDPTEPKLTARLTTPAMLSPHESVVLSEKRGILAAVSGNATFAPGIVDVYDVSKDCRHPQLRSTSPVGVFGHESGMAPDGRTFYSASPGTSTIVAVDISDPTRALPLWYGNYDSHGLSISADGNRAYVAGIDSGLIILDISEIQARVPNPTVREVARLKWESMSIPQNAIPITVDDHPYVVEIDEYGGTSGTVGAGRIIDIADETKPRVVSNLRLEVHQPENLAEASHDPGAQIPVQGYGGHYCNVPDRTDPKIVACSMIISGLRVFDIRDPENPKEIAYFNAPIPKRDSPAFEASNWAMASPSFVPERNEIWYSDGYSGFHVVRLTNGAWPANGGSGGASGGGCNRIAGTRGKDRINGTAGADCIRGGAGPDRLAGGRGNDRIRGGLGRDRIRAGAGNDLVFAARGSRDVVDCGTGKDTAHAKRGKDRLRRCEKIRG